MPTAQSRKLLSPGVVFALLTGLYCAWILTLPVFPSQDGPVHLYYANVAARLFSGSAAFSAHFEIAHVLPPYSLHYYALIVLLRWFSPVFAEKLLVCGYIAIAAFGLRFFATRIGPFGAVLSIFALPFVLHRYLFLGLYNYCIALGLALLGMGIWSTAERSRPTRRAAFFLLVVVITLTHPVPLLLLIGYCGIVLLLGCCKQPEGWKSDFPRAGAGDWLTWAAASASMIYVSLFLNRTEMYPDQVPVAAVQGFRFHWLRLREFMEMFLVSPITSGSYRVLLMGLLIGATVVAVLAARRDLISRRITFSQLVLASGLLLIAGVALLPTWINGSALFAERLTISCVLLLMIAAARFEYKRVDSILVLAGALVSLVALLAVQTAVGPAARRVSLPKQSTSVDPYARSLMIPTLNTPVGLTFDPCRSCGVRLIQEEDGIWMNPPWLGSPQLIIGSKQKPTPMAEMLATDPGIGVVVVHCGGPDSGVTAALESRYPGRWSVTNNFWANVLRPKRP